MDLRLGKKPAAPSDRDFHLSRYLVELPTPPRVFGFGTLYTNWGMLGNDRYGDCVFAGAAHETMVWNKARRGSDVLFDDEAVLRDYAAVTGFDPFDEATDQGTFVRDAMSYRRKTGVTDAEGVHHYIEAYVSIDPKDWEQLVRAAFIFGCVGIGFEFPETAWAQFDAGVPWQMVDPSAAIDGGHYVPVVGSRHSDKRVTCITWGERQQLTRAFYEAYNDEAWVPLSLEQIRPDGLGLHGLDLETLEADLAAL